MGILNREELIEKISNSDYSKKLVVTPLLSENQIGPASIDIRLGSSIVIPRRTYIGSQDVTEKQYIQTVERRLYDRVRLHYHQKFVLHPNEMILAVTFEYISLPFDVFATVVSRSSWGRLGLVIATASVVQPGYKGCLTLELANLSVSPIVLYPGLLVGQLIFYSVPSKGSKNAIYKGRYTCPTEAEPPNFFAKNLDSDMEFWGEEKLPKLP